MHLGGFIIGIRTDVSIYFDILQFIFKSVSNCILHQLFKDIHIKQVRIFTRTYHAIDCLQKRIVNKSLFTTEPCDCLTMGKLVLLMCVSLPYR